METPDRVLAEKASRRYGLITRAEAIATGLSSSDIQYRLSTGRWRRARRNVYAIAGAPECWEQRLLAAQMSLGTGAYVSHRAAAVLWEFPGFVPGPIEFVVAEPRSGSSSPGVRIHRTGDLRAGDRRRLNGFRVTDPCRTIIDLAAVCPWGLVEEALDDALRRRLFTMKRIASRVADLRATRRPGLRKLDDALALRRPVKTESVLEDRFLRLVRCHQLPAPVCQYRIRHGGTFIARVDFAFPDRRIAIECDGFRHHSGPRKWDLDARRARALTAAGWLVYRFTWADVVKRPADTAREIEAALSHRASRDSR